VDALLGGGGGRAYDGFVHFDYKPPRSEAIDGVWESARACMRNYLILRDKVQAFRADPEVRAALDAAEVGALDEPTVGAGESLADLRATSYDVEALGHRSVNLEAVDQLALEHLLGVR
jgi:xylose isomerase